MIRVSSILSRTLAATRAGSTATRAVTAVPNRFLQAAHYGSSTESGGHDDDERLIWRICLMPPFVFAAYMVMYQPKRPLHDLTDDIVLYQTEGCFSCNKVRVFLDYYDIPYKVVEVDLLGGNKIRWSEYRDVPILVVDGEQLNGSSAIIDRLGQKILSNQIADSTSEDDEETKWQQWADAHLLPVLESNKFRTASETLESMDHMMSNTTLIKKVVLNCTLVLPVYVLCKLMELDHNITDERAALYEALQTWVDALNGREFLGGSEPNLADLAVFGLLKSVRCLSCGKDAVEHTQIGEWYTRMENAVGKSSRIEF